MKTKFNHKKLSVALLSGFIAPQFAMAGNSQFSGLSDSILLTLMLGVILILLFVINAIAQTIISINKRYKKPNSKTAKALLTLTLLGTGFSASANTQNAWESFYMGEGLFWLLTAIIFILAAIIFYLFRTLKVMIVLQSGESFEEEEKSVFDVLNSSLTDNVPIEEESNVMLDHEYDGIRELDNNLPPWWKYMFYATIVFAFVYLIRFHITGGGLLSHAEYAAEMQEAEEQKALVMADAGEQITEDNVAQLIDEASLTKGAAIFSGNCATCHGQNGEGGAGPNLSDEYFIHGGGIANTFKSIKYGIPAKGMIAWQSQFNATQIQEVASYVLSLVGSNPANPKDPQGELWESETQESDTTSVNTE